MRIITESDLSLIEKLEQRQVLAGAKHKPVDPVFEELEALAVAKLHEVFGNEVGSKVRVTCYGERGLWAPDGFKITGSFEVACRKFKLYLYSERNPSRLSRRSERLVSLVLRPAGMAGWFTSISTPGELASYLKKH